MKRTGAGTTADNAVPVRERTVEQPGTVDAASVVDAFRRINQALRVSSRALQEQAGISGAQMGALRYLADAPAMSLGELAQRLRTRHSSASAVIARLVRLGLVERMRNPADTRRVILRLSRAGRALVRDAPEDADARLATAAAALPRTRLRELVTALDALARALDTLPNEQLQRRDSVAPLRTTKET